MHLLLLVLTFLVFSSTTESTPIVSIVKKTQLRPVLLMSGVIVTERHVLTLAHPLISCCKENLRLLTGYQDFRFMTDNMTKCYGYNIKSYITARPDPSDKKTNHVNLAVLETHTPIRFYLRVNRVTIMPRDRIRINHCHVIYPVRKSIVQNYRILSAHHMTLNWLNISSMSKISGPGFRVHGVAQERMQVCRSDSGAPIICQYTLLGLLAYPLYNAHQNRLYQCGNSPQDCLRKEMEGHFNCMLVEEGQKFALNFINIYSDQAVKLLDRVRDINSYS